jgi:hypothetical protein
MIIHNSLITAVRKNDNHQSRHHQQRHFAHREIVDTPLFLLDIVNQLCIPISYDLRFQRVPLFFPKYQSP